MIDKLKIVAKGGDGGSGIVSFRREKFVPFGGPDGGDGGYGGDVILVADSRLRNLSELKRRKYYRAGSGERGGGNKRHGRNGEDLVLRVPLGTLVIRETDASLLVDLKEDGQRVVVAKGGRGGWGNARFASPTNQAPRISKKGTSGEECPSILDLKLIADVGIIGYPNVGKSTLLAAASAAAPKIADYPFTTLEPVLGVVEMGYRNFVLAEIPGLIEGAHLGRGLGHEFLRHAERTQILIHLLDASSASPLVDMKHVNEELVQFNPALAQKPQVLAVNKIDLPQVRVAEVKEMLEAVVKPVFFISALTGEGVPQLMVEVSRMLSQLKEEKEVPAAPGQFIFHPEPKDIVVHRQGDVFVVSAPKVEQIISGIDLSTAEGRGYVRRQMVKLGVDRALKRAGVKAGDRVRFGSVEIEWE